MGQKHGNAIAMGHGPALRLNVQVRVLLSLYKNTGKKKRENLDYGKEQDTAKHPIGLQPPLVSDPL